MIGSHWPAGWYILILCCLFQENFELTHETLYLAVKLVDHYLVEVVSMRDKLQLIGSTAILIASKFEVTHCLPSSELGKGHSRWGRMGAYGQARSSEV